MSRRRTLSAGDAALGVFLAAAVVAVGRGQSGLFALALGALLLASFVLEIDRVHPALASSLERVSWALVAAVGALGVGWTLYAFVGGDVISLARNTAGAGLAVAGAVFFSGTRVWSPGRGLIPTGLALLVLAGLDPVVPLTVPVVVSALALTAHLLLASPTTRSQGVSQARGFGGLWLYAGTVVAVALALAIALPVAQPLVEAAAASMMNTGGSGVGEGPSSLGEIERLALSKRVVMRVWSDRPLYLRAGV